MAKKKKYVPTLLRMAQQSKTEAWQEKAPRLTEGQKEEIQKITSAISQKYTRGIDRSSFLDIHEKIEREVSDRIMSEFGLVAAVEWQGQFSPDNARQLMKLGIQRPVVENVLPTHDFLNSETFDYVQVWRPTVVLFTFEDKTDYFDSAEASIKEAEKRRRAGDAYYTRRDRDINYKPSGESEA